MGGNFETLEKTQKKNPNPTNPSFSKHPAAPHHPKTFSSPSPRRPPYLCKKIKNREAATRTNRSFDRNLTLPSPGQKPEKTRSGAPSFSYHLQPSAGGSLSFASLFPSVVPSSQPKPFPSSSIFIFFAPDLPHPSLGRASPLAVALPLSEDRPSGPSHHHFPCRTKDPSLFIPVVPYHQPPSPAISQISNQPASNSVSFPISSVCFPLQSQL